MYAGERCRSPMRFQERGAHKDLRSPSQVQGRREHPGWTTQGWGWENPEALTVRSQKTTHPRTEQEMARVRQAVAGPSSL